MATNADNLRKAREAKDATLLPRIDAAILEYRASLLALIPEGKRIDRQVILDQWCECYRLELLFTRRIRCKGRGVTHEERIELSRLQTETVKRLAWLKLESVPGVRPPPSLDDVSRER